MRWFVATLIVLCIAIAVWLGTALHAVGELATAVRAADGATVLARTDLPAVRRSLTDQLVRGYIERAGETRKVSQIERMIASTYGATVADALVAKLLTPETLTALLKKGQVDGAGNTPAIDGVPALADLNTDNIFGLIGRLGFIQPVLLSVRISPGKEPDKVASVQVHLDGAGWRLAGVELPKATIRQLVANLPVR